MKMEQTDFPKRRHVKFRHRGITQKKENNIQNMAKVWNQEQQNSHDGLSSRMQEYLLHSKIFVICIGNYAEQKAEWAQF